MKRLLYVFAALAMLQLCGCSKERVPVRNSGTIAIMPVMDQGETPTRASLYNNELELREDIFHTLTYLAGTSSAYFDSGAKYSTEDLDPTKHRWLFYNGAYVEYYWPIEQSLDFFAYAPQTNGYVTVNSAVNPPTFTANMPLNNTSGAVHQENMKEFAYAYTPDRDQSGGPVPLAFHHPLSGIVFRVSQSQRDLTVKSITIGGIKYVGTCSYTRENPETPTWSYTSESGNLTLAVNKIIPGTVNFGGELCGPYMVLPQVNAADAVKELRIECHWKGYNTESDDEAADTKVLTGKITNDWEPSKIYTYSLDLGNSREEILFKVSVAPWKYVYEHVFEIE